MAAIPIDPADITLSVSQLAREFGMDRNDLGARLKAANLKPNGDDRGHPRYRLNESIQAVFKNKAQNPDGDPDLMKPTDRLAWFKSELSARQLDVEEGRLIPVQDVEDQMAWISKTVGRVLATLPDRMERDLRVTPEMVEYALSDVHKVQTELAKELAR